VGDHFAAAARQLGRPVVKPPPLHHAAVHVWNVFARLSSARSGNGFGPNPISYGEVAAYCAVTGDDLLPWEAEALRELDDVFLEEAAKAAERSANERRNR
jgi:hypothetical protein